MTTALGVGPDRDRLRVGTRRARRESCSTRSSGELVKRDYGTLACQLTPGTQGYDVRCWFRLAPLAIEGAAARVVHEALAVEPVDGGAGRKRASGVLTCTMNGDAEAAAAYSCVLPDVLTLDGEPARPLFEALRGEEERSGSIVTRSVDGDLECWFDNVTTGIYFCQVP